MVRYMTLPSTILVATILIAALSIKSTQAGYRRINDYLIKQVRENDDVSANMEAASRWLKEQESKKTSCFSSVPISSLSKFTALQQVIDDSKCDRTTYEIMRANEEATGRSNLESEEKAFRRVDKVILKIFRAHAERCYKVYPVICREKFKQLDGQIVKQAVDLAKTLTFYDRDFRIPEQRFNQPANLYDRYIRNSISIEPYLGGILKVVLNNNAKGDPDLKYLKKTIDERTGKSVINKGKIKDLVQKYMIEPCKMFVENFDSDVFTPARFELRYYTVKEKPSTDFYLTWSFFMICKAVTENDGVVINDIITKVANEKR